MQALFSEFSYGFALSYELTRAYEHLLTAAPHLPSSRQEGQEGGYDIGLPLRGFPVFLQFKRGQYMLRSNAAEWDFFKSRYYRFDLHPLRHSPQHHLLIDLEESGNQVYYAAPGFHEAKELNEAFRNQSVAARSLFFRPSDIGRLPDRDRHRVAYRLTDRFGYLFSTFQPKKIPISSKGLHFIEELERRSLREESVRLTPDYYEQLANRMIAMVLEQIQFEEIDPRDVIEELTPFNRVAYLARMFFDTELLLVSASEQGG